MQEKTLNGEVLVLTSQDVVLHHESFENKDPVKKKIINLCTLLALFSLSFSI